MTQLADLLVVVLLLVAIAARLPQVVAALGEVFRVGPGERDRDASRRPVVIDLVLCPQCQTASPVTARFCKRCGSRLPARRS